MFSVNFSKIKVISSLYIYIYIYIYQSWTTSSDCLQFIQNFTKYKRWWHVSWSSELETIKQMDGIVYRILSKQAKIKKCLHWLIFHTKMYNWCWECGLKMVQKLETYVNCLGFNSESLPCQCYPLSSTEANKCLFRWRHLFEISDFLFSMIASSPFAMRTFSAVQREHFLEIGL